MESCGKCKKEYEEDEEVYAIEVTQCSSNDIGSGSVEVHSHVCSDCYHMYFWDLSKL